MKYESFKNVEIKGFNQIAFDCYAIQLIALCKYYNGEYWKMLIENPIEYIPIPDKVNIEDRIKISYTHNGNKLIKSYYGIDLTNYAKDKNTELDFNDNKVFLAIFDTTKYPPTTGMEVDYDSKTHSFIIYNKNEENYIIYDAFYGMKEYYLNKELFYNGVITLYEVQINPQIINNNLSSDDLVLRRCQEDDYCCITKWFYDCFKYNTFSYHKDIFFIKLRNVFSKVEALGIILREILGENTYVSEASRMLHNIFEQLRGILYYFMKIQLKHKMIDKDTFITKFKQIEDLFKQEDTIRKEVIRILKNDEKSLSKDIKNKLDKYLGRPVDLNLSVYDDHDGVTILNLINFIEDEYGLEFDILSYSGVNTYNDFAVRVFHNLLSKNVEKRN